MLAITPTGLRNSNQPLIYIRWIEEVPRTRIEGENEKEEEKEEENEEDSQGSGGSSFPSRAIISFARPVIEHGKKMTIDASKRAS